MSRRTGAFFLFSIGTPECRAAECVGLAAHPIRGCVLPTIVIEGDWSQADVKRLPDAFVGITSHETIEYLVETFVSEIMGLDCIFDLHDLIGKNPPTAAYARNPSGLVFLKHAGHG